MHPFPSREKSILDLETQIAGLSNLGDPQQAITKTTLQKKLDALRTEQVAQYTAWEKVLLARHSQRPHSADVLAHLFPDFMELHGDRRFAEDAAILAGVATFETHSICVIAQDKGKTTKQKLERNFGMPKPEGYRKALRIAQLAHQFHLPLITFIDTPGAYPGIAAEERGQAQAIAESIQTFFQLNIPIIAVILGEGGSGGALALGVADQVLMCEHSVYSVISPESCASILWKDAGKAPQAAEKLKMQSQDCLRLGVIDAIIPEPAGGAHYNPTQAYQYLHEALFKTLTHTLSQWETHKAEWPLRRIQKFRRIGLDFLTTPLVPLPSLTN